MVGITCGCGREHGGRASLVRRDGPDGGALLANCPCGVTIIVRRGEVAHESVGRWHVVPGTVLRCGRVLRPSAGRASLREQMHDLLERTAVKLDLTPLGCAVDVAFLESVVRFVSSVQTHLDSERDTLPPGPPLCTCADGAACPAHDTCGRCGQLRAECSCV